MRFLVRMTRESIFPPPKCGHQFCNPNGCRFINTPGLATAPDPSGEDMDTKILPIDIVLYCPKCGHQHIDEPESEEHYQLRLKSAWVQRPERWMNPPHKSHLCRREDGGCGHVWRPSDNPTNGVAGTKSGKHSDTSPAKTI